jgi:hypothetical protein
MRRTCPNCFFVSAGPERGGGVSSCPIDMTLSSADLAYPPYPGLIAWSLPPEIGMGKESGSEGTLHD